MKNLRVRNLLIISVILAVIGSELLVVSSAEAENNQIAQLDIGIVENPRIKLKSINFDPIKEDPYIPEKLRLSEQNGYFLVQCKGAIQSEWLDNLKILGVTILGYVPDYAYVVHMDVVLKNIVEQLPFIRWIGYYHPFYKISPDLSSKAGIVELNVMVFKTGDETNLFRVISGIESLKGVITYNGTDNSIIRTKIDASKIDAIASLPEVAWIDEYTEPEALMDNIRSFTGADMLHLNGYDGSGIVGEVKDNGFDPNHPDFVGQIAGIDGSPPVRAHGTATFGIVFSSGTNSATAKGMLPGAQGVFAHWSVPRITSVSNLVNNWGGVFQSNSWSSGFPNGQYTSFSEDNDQAVFDYDVTMLYAAGNGGGAQTITQDAAAKNVIAVGGILHYDNADRTDDNHIAGSSGNSGPAADSRIKPDLCGPFDEIYTTDVAGAGGYSSGDYTGSFGGTSGATPVVAGATGLVYQMYMSNHFGNNPLGAQPHASTVKAILIADAYQYDFTQADRYEQGWGLVDVSYVYNTGMNHFIVDQDVALQTGESMSYNITAMGTQPLKISLVWTDPPALPSANPALVNDLDLKVTAPDGTTAYWGNRGLITGKWSISGGLPDDLNNVENVFIQSPSSAGIWKIEVIADNVAGDGNLGTPNVDQHFALVVSGGVPGGGVDSAPPITSHSLAGTLGANGWYVSNVAVTLTATDDFSGVANTYYSVDLSPWNVYTAPFVVSGEGQHMVQYYSVDNNGNVEIMKSFLLKIDTMNPEYSSASPITATIYDSDMNMIRLQLNWTDVTSGISDVKFRYRYGSGPWSGWNIYAGFSVDTYWYDIPRTSWINYVGLQLDWESYSADMAGLQNTTSTFDGTTILDDDPTPPSFANLSSDGNIFDSYADVYRVQTDWNDTSGISAVEFRYSNDTILWSSWFNYTGFSGDTHWYDIPKSQWINFVGSGVYWESKALDNDSDRANDSLEISTQPQFGGFITDDDENAPSYANPSPPFDIYDSNTSDYSIQIDWTDDSGLLEVEFRHRYDLGPWSPWYNYTTLSGNSYWYDILRTDWIDHVGFTISWQSRAKDNDNDRALDYLYNYTEVQNAGNILDDDDMPPLIGSYGDDYDVGSISYALWVTGADISGWTLYIQYYYSLDPFTIYSLVNLTSEILIMNLSVTIKEPELKGHEGETIYWRYMLEDGDNDRSGDSLNTSWSDWIQGITLDFTPPITTHDLAGDLGMPNWYVSNVTVSLTAVDSISGIDYTKYRINGGPWITYGDSFEIVESGTHTIGYYSADKAGNIELVNIVQINIDNTKPVADAGPDQEVFVGSTVVFDGSDSEDNSGIQNYEWKIEKDGNLISNSSGITQAYNFDEVGYYKVTLTVTDYVGNTDDDVIWVDVIVMAPEGDIWTWQWLLIILMPIIIFILLLLILFWRRKRKEDEPVELHIIKRDK